MAGAALVTPVPPATDEGVAAVLEVLAAVEEAADAPALEADAEPTKAAVVRGAAFLTGEVSSESMTLLPVLPAWASWSALPSWRVTAAVWTRDARKSVRGMAECPAAAFSSSR